MGYTTENGIEYYQGELGRSATIGGVPTPRISVDLVSMFTCPFEDPHNIDVWPYDLHHIYINKSPCVFQVLSSHRSNFHAVFYSSPKVELFIVFNEARIVIHTEPERVRVYKNYWEPELNKKLNKILVDTCGCNYNNHTGRATPYKLALHETEEAKARAVPKRPKKWYENIFN